MSNNIPNSVIGAVSSVIAEHYYSHSTLNILFMESGAPGEVPEGNCEKKCSSWLKRCNSESSVDALSVLGEVIQEYMELESSEKSKIYKGQERIKKALEKNQLSYQLNGQIVLAGSNPTTKTLSEYLKSGDFSSVEDEFKRALKHINTDPHASITAACSIIEALCKTYIEAFKLTMPAKQSVTPLWKEVKSNLSLNLDPNIEKDQFRILQGLSSIVDGVGALRTHIGSAHGRGKKPPKIKVSEARLAVNSSHTLVTYVMERWHTSA